ncbi:ATP-grasp domain-containing protein [Trueperella sp.]|uniref:carboxylate--amine ligase n=1 Tax=Trueperella sp. TaxID=2699835 RepID=UPI0037363AAC
MATPPILPVVFGSDVADYSIARLLHETFGIKTLVIAQFMRGPVDNSKIVDVRLVPRETFYDPKLLLPLFHEIADEFPDLTPVLLGNEDNVLNIAMAHRDELEPRWFLPLSDRSVLDLANNKDAMASLLSDLGYASPTHVNIELGDPSTWDAITFLRTPLIAKPTIGGDQIRFHQTGLQKVASFDTHDQARQYFDDVASAGGTMGLIVQELIPGDDTTQWVINGYINKRGEITAIGTGQVILGIHEPNLIGNAGIIYVRENAQLIEQATRILTAVGLRGFFSLDAKYDPRDNTPYWLDLNPRIGRGNYYLKVGGINLATALIDDMVGRALADRGSAQTLQREGLFSVMPKILANRHYVEDPELWKKVKSLKKHAVDPLDYSADRHPKRTLFRIAAGINHVRRTRMYYPELTETGF